MYRNEVSFIMFRGMWLVATHFIVDLQTGKQNIRSYDGAFFVGNNINRTMVMWESEKPATYEEIYEHAPEPCMRQEDYRIYLDMQEKVSRQYAKAQAEAARKGTEWFLKGLVILLGAALVVYSLHLIPT